VITKEEKLSWDESLPESQNTEWSAICTSFGQIRHASFPRLVRSPNSESEIHGFCDASIEAMVPVSTSFATADLNYFAQSQGWPP